MTKASKPSSPVFVPNPKARLFDQVREVMRFHHYALRTEEASQCLGVFVRAGIAKALGGVERICAGESSGTAARSAHARGDAACAGGVETGNEWTDHSPFVWHWDAPHRMSAFTGEGCGFCARSDCGAGRQGGQRPGDDVAGELERGTPGTFASGQVAA